MARARIAEFAASESGATSIEYALIASIVSVSIILALTQVKGSLQTAFNNVATQISSNGK